MNLVALVLLSAFSSQPENKAALDAPEKLAKGLIGSWVFQAVPAFAITGNKIVWSFHEDGTFTDVIGSDKGVSVESGTWAINGAHLVMKTKGQPRTYHERRYAVSKLTETEFVYRAQKRNEGVDSDFRFDRAGKIGSFLFLEKTKSDKAQSEELRRKLIGAWTWNDTVGGFTANGNRQTYEYFDDGKYTSVIKSRSGRADEVGAFRVDGSILTKIEKKNKFAATDKFSVDVAVIKEITENKVAFVDSEGVQYSFLRGADAVIPVKKLPESDAKVEKKQLVGAWICSNGNELDYWQVEFDLNDSLKQSIRGGGKPGPARTLGGSVNLGACARGRCRV